MPAMLAATLAALAASCASSDDDPSVETEAQAAVSPTWINPACTEAALAPPIIPGVSSETCNGPWRFEWEDQVCIPAHCPHYNLAANWHRFVDGDWLAVGIKDDVQPNGTPLWTVQAPVYTYQVRESCTFGKCRPLGTTGQRWDIKCPVVAGDVRNAIIADTTNLPTNLVYPPLQIADPLQNHTEVLRRLQVNSTWNITGREQFTEEGVRYTTTWFQCWTQTVGRPVKTTGEWPANQCAVEIVPETCTTATGTERTEPGQSIPTSPGASSLPGGTRRFVDGPDCQTCDAIPLSSASDKLACYEATADSADATLRASLVARRKLLLQLAGERLSADERTRIYDLYDAEDGAAACSTTVAWADACADDDTGRSLARRAQLCHDLVSNTAASIGAIDVAFAYCASLLEETAQIPAVSCRLGARDGIDADLQALMARREPTFGTDLSATLPAVLERLHLWSAAAHHAAMGDEGWIVARTATLVGRLWQAVHDARRTLPPPLVPGAGGTVEAAAQLVTDVERDDLLTDLAVLDQVFAPGRITSPVALTLVGDALTAVADRAEQHQRFHDVGCHVVGCKPGTTARASALAELTAALAALPRQAELADVLAHAPRLLAQAPGLHATLGHIRDHHDYLTSAWTQAGRSLADFARLATLNDLPPEFAALGGLVRRATIASASYQAGGLFTSTFQPRPTTAVLQPLALAQDLQRNRDNLIAARAAYETARVDQVNLALQAAAADGVLEALRQRGVQISNRKRVLIEQLVGLQQREQQERAQLARYQKAFEAVVLSGVLKPNEAYSVVDLPLIEASAADARFPMTATVMNLTRDAFTQFDVHSGQTLRFEVSGTWSPSCRLRTQTIATPTGPATINVPSGPLGEFPTGPRGYWASYGASTFDAKSITDAESWSTTYSQTASVCLNSSNVLPPGVQSLWSAEACTSVSTSHSTGHSEEESSGRENKFAAEFNVGIRLAHTPVPTAPAGALLAVLTPVDSPNQFLDVRVVDERASLVVPNLPNGVAGTVRVHLVVNDSTGCPLPANPSRLQIQRTQVLPVGEVAGLLSGATASGLAAIEAAAVAVVAQGQLPPSESNRLRGLAWTKAQDALAPVSIADLPAELRLVFDTTVDVALASLERRALMAGTYNDLDRLDDELAALRQEYASAATQRHLTGLLPRLRLRALDGDELLARSDALARVIAVHVIQTLTLRALTWQPQQAGDIASLAEALIDLPLASPLVNGVVTLEQLATAMQDGLLDQQFDPFVPAPQLIVVAIPYPRGSGDALRYMGPYREVSRAAARQFWDAALSATTPRATITLSPQDLYGGESTAARLSCSTQGAMIRRMAVFLEHASTSDLNVLNINASTSVGAAASLDFPLLGRTYSVPAVVGGVPGLVRVLGDRVSGEVQNRFNAYVPQGLGAAAGLSPFTSFSIDMAFIRDPALVNFRNYARALYLVFEVEGRESAGAVTVPGLCGVVAN